ncbi:MAG: tRNA (N6-isopentenyl adenosine(37)-C2)-methylthiotransferase MiaB [Acidobacteriota bacterium]
MKKVYIETHGCQMNVHDTEKAVSVLADAGYQTTVKPAEADLILLNTCMVREKAARKVFSRIGNLKSEVRASRPVTAGAPVIGVMGCVAQAEAGRIFDLSRDVRLVIGTQSIGKLPDLLSQLDSGFPRAIDVRLSKDADFLQVDPRRRDGSFVSYISIIEGCNKFCSYCIVPFTRGRERSRDPQSILEEAIGLAQAGYKEVQLLGQNVNSYRLNAPGIRESSNDAQIVRRDTFSFANLLELLARESGLSRIKYTTSFPRDFTPEIIEVMDRYENLCEWVHLPPQSGSDRILRAMRRGYNRLEYLEKIRMIRNGARDYSITGDIIIGFPGETEADFIETLTLVAEVEFDGLYIFNYSPRPHTPAAAYADSVPEAVKGERFGRLQELQERIQKRRFGRYINREVEVLVESLSARSENDHTGHTKCNKVVNFPKAESNLGDVVKVLVKESRPHSLYGELISKRAEVPVGN